MNKLLLLAALAAWSGAAAAADPPKDDAFAALKGKGGVPRSYDLRGTAATASGTNDILVNVERYRPLAEVKTPEVHRDVFENDPGIRSPLDDKLASTRSGYRDGCHAGSVCYGSAPGLRDTVGSLFGW